MASRRSVRSLFLGLCIALFATTVFAAPGRLAGRITRADGSGIGGVIVQVVELSRVELTDPDGNFRFDNIAPGTYTVSFVAADQAATENNVVVSDGQTARVDKQVDWSLSLAETITVYSASRRTERVVEAPASVTVASEEQIEAAAPSGQAPRIIENAPGVDFTQSGLYDFNFNARGFNSSLNRRILTLVDGRDPSVPFLGAQEWAALSFPMDEFAAVELVRGPGSALYGPNAFSGVLNMTTKQPKLNPGGRLLLTGGDLNTKRGDIRHAGGFGNETYYRVVGGYSNSDDYTRSRNVTVEYSVPCAAAGAINCLPKEPAPLALEEVTVAYGGIRFDKHFADTNVLTLEGGYATLEGPTFQTGIGRVQVTDVAHPWARVNYNMPHWNFLAYYDGRIAERQVALSSGSGVIPNTPGLWEDSFNIHGEVQTNWGFFNDRTRVVLGAAYNTQEVDTADPNGFHTLMPEAKEERQQAVFGQLEFDITNNLKILGAARWDDSTLHEAQFSPKGAIVYSFATNHSVRYGYNEAFQRPNYSELFLRAPAGAPANLAAAAAANPATAPLAPLLGQLGFGPLPILALGNSNLEVEKVQSHEIGYAGIYGGKLFLTLDLYRSEMSDFVTDLLPGVNTAFAPYQIPSTVPPQAAAFLNQFLTAALASRRPGLTTVNGAPALVFSYANAGEVSTQGFEIATNYYITNNWLFDFNYAWFDFDVKSAQAGDRLLPNAPEHKFNTGLSWRGTRFDARAGYRWVDEFDWAAGSFVGKVEKYHVLNLGANIHLTDMIGLGFDVSNATGNEHYEAFGGDLLERRALGFVSVNW
ncbi:MAG TPA: TonB-dependent receptor [Thermoanaerobaculia bacterium]